MLTRRLFNANAASMPSPLGILPGDLPGMYFYPDGDPPTPPSADPPAPAPQADPPADPAPGNQENAWRRKAEAAEKRLKDLEDAENKRKLAEMSETERVKAEAETAKAEAAETKKELLKLKIANELGVSADALDLLTGADEPTIRAQAEKIVALTGKTAPAPVTGGTRTQPGGQQQPTTDEKIAAAMKSGDSITAIRLMREKQGIGK